MFNKLKKAYKLVEQKNFYCAHKVLKEYWYKQFLITNIYNIIKVKKFLLNQLKKGKR